MKTNPVLLPKRKKASLIVRISLILAFLLSTITPHSILAAGTSNGITGPTDAMFRPGMWWDPKLNGSGWEINRGGNNVFGIWYTYQEDGSPIWYLTSGLMEEGRFEHDLLSFTWDYDKNQINETIVAGSVSIEFSNSQLAEVSWKLGDQQGSHFLQPFIFATTPTLDDHSGSWSDPTESGYGFTIQTQDDISYAVLYYYDEKGEPTWAAGTRFSGDQGHAMVDSDNGACPGCAYRKPDFKAAGELVTSYHSEARMQVDLTLTDAVPFWTKTQTQHRMFSHPPSGRAHSAALATIASADALALYFKAGFQAGNGPQHGTMICLPPIVSPAPPAVSAPANPSVSATNVQEQGVDEADVIKVTPDYLYSLDYASYEIPFSDGRLERNQSITRYLFSTPGEPPIGDGNYAVTLPSPISEYGSGYLRNQGLYHHTNAEAETQKLIYLSTVVEGICGIRLAASTHVQAFDTGSGADFLVDNQLEIDGELIASRTIDDHLFLALNYQPDLYELTEKAFGAEVAQQLQNDGTAFEVLFESVNPELLLPTIKYSNGDISKPLVTTENIMMPPLPLSNIKPVLSILLMFDLNDLSIAPQSIALMGAMDGIYATTKNVYFASSRADYTLNEAGTLSRSGFVDTDIHKLAISADNFTYLGSGSVEGAIGEDPELLAFRMSESDDHLRVISSSRNWRERWGELGRHRLTILGEANSEKLLMSPVSILPNAERPKNIGKPGEDIYAVRFHGKRAYVVTFERIDPLYALDLSEAEDPFILGELEIEGFSSYLHPVGEDLLIGIGMNAVSEITPEQTRLWFQGMQVGLFDVGELSSPVLLDLHEIGYRGTSSPLFQTHHAFTSIPGDTATGEPMRFIIPVVEHAPADGIVDPDPGYWYPWSNTGIHMFELHKNMDEISSLKLVGNTAIASSEMTDENIARFYQSSSEEHSRSVIYDDQVYFYYRGGLFETEWSGNTFTPADNCPLCTPIN